LFRNGTTDMPTSVPELVRVKENVSFLEVRKERGMSNGVVERKEEKRREEGERKDEGKRGGKKYRKGKG
jgi:hypothetical protein